MTPHHNSNNIHELLVGRLSAGSGSDGSLHNDIVHEDEYSHKQNEQLSAALPTTTDDDDESEADHNGKSFFSRSVRRLRRPSNRSIVDRLVERLATADEDYHHRPMTQKEMEILGKLTHANSEAKRMVAHTQALIPRMIESYVGIISTTRSQQNSSSISSSEDEEESPSWDETEMLDLSSSPKTTRSTKHHHTIYRKRMPPRREVMALSAIWNSFSSNEPERVTEEALKGRHTSPQYLFVFCKALQACVVDCPIARTQCRNSNLYRALLFDLDRVSTSIENPDTRHALVQAMISLLCVLCLNDSPNAKYFKQAQRERNNLSLRIHVGDDLSMGQRVSFLESFSLSN